MSYKISYGAMSKKTRNKPIFRLKLPVIAGAVLAFAITARVFWPQQTKQLAEALFPLTKASSQEALEVFARNIKAGESFGDAVTAFCQEIIHEADIS